MNTSSAWHQNGNLAVQGTKAWYSNGKLAINGQDAWYEDGSVAVSGGDAFNPDGTIASENVVGMLFPIGAEITVALNDKGISAVYVNGLQLK